MEHHNASAFALRPNHAVHAAERWGFSLLLFVGILVLLILNPVTEEHKWLIIPGFLIAFALIFIEGQQELTRRALMTTLVIEFCLLGLGIMYQTSSVFIFCHVGVAALVALFLMFFVFSTSK